MSDRQRESLSLTPAGPDPTPSRLGRDLRRAVADLVLETTSEGIWLIDAESRTTFVNTHTAHLLGYTVDEMLGAHLFAFMDEEGKKICEANLERRRGGIEEQHEFKFLRKDGTPIWLLLATNPVYDRSGAYAGALAMLDDISAQKQREAELRERVRDLEGVAQAKTRGALELEREIEPSGCADRAAEPPTRLPWREAVMRGMLTVVGGVAPLFSALGLLVRSAPLTAVDVLVLMFAGALPPVLWLARWPSIRARASVAITIGLAAGVYFLARIGFVAGVGVVLVATPVIGVICLGRRFGLALIATSALAHLVIGRLVGEGSLTLDLAYLDPFKAQNWIRAAVATTLIASLLALIVDFVIRQLERTSVEVTGTLSQLRRLHVRLERTEEEERRFLARELHDELGQILTTLKARLTLTGASTHATARPPGLESPGDLIDRLIGRVRTLSSALRPPLLDEVGLVSAVRVFLDAQAAATGLEVSLDATEQASRDRLPPDVEIACFRIIQESVTNAVRHASARRLQIAVDQDARRVALVIRDDGRGFDGGVTLDAAAAAGHLGVVGMRERVRARGGSFRLGSQPGSGTVVEVELPLA